MAMTQHERRKDVRVVREYNADTLGAPFKVTLINSVTLGINPKTGEETVQIPDLVGLINEVVRSRLCHTKKFSGEDIKFIRNALGVRANKLASFLGVSPEHLSRCEAGAKVLSEGSEKVFRLFAFMATFFQEPEDLLLGNVDPRVIKTMIKKPNEMMDGLIKMFLTMRIRSAFDPKEVVAFEFSYKEKSKSAKKPTLQEGEWKNKDKNLIAA